MKKPNEPGTERSPEVVDEREPYEAPRMEAEELYETLALACGKIRPVTFACSRSPNQS